MSDESFPEEPSLLNLVEWVRARAAQPKVAAAIDALGPAQAAEVREGIRAVLSDYGATRTVSPAAIKAFAVGPRRMVEFMPVVFPSQLAKPEETLMANPNRPPKEPSE